MYYPRHKCRTQQSSHSSSCRSSSSSSKMSGKDYTGTHHHHHHTGITSSPGSPFQRRSKNTADPFSNSFCSVHHPRIRTRNDEEFYGGFRRSSSLRRSNNNNMDIHNRELLTLRHDTIPPDFGQALVEKKLGSFLKKI